MRRLLKVILILMTSYIVFVSISIAYIEFTSDEIQTCYVKVNLKNESASTINNLYISSSSSNKYKAFPEIAPSEIVEMDVHLPVVSDSSALLTYSDESGNDHHAMIVGYLMMGHEVDVTLISADEDGLVIEALEK